MKASNRSTTAAAAVAVTDQPKKPLYYVGGRLASSRQHLNSAGSGIPMPISGGAKSRSTTNGSKGITTAPAKKKLATLSNNKSSTTTSKAELPTLSRIPGTTVKRKLSIGTRSKASSLGVLTSKRDRPDPDVAAGASTSKPSRPKTHDKRRPGLTMFSKKIMGNVQTASENIEVSEQDQRLRDQEVMQLEREKDELRHRVSELIHSAEAKKTEVITLKMEIGKLKENQKSKSETVLFEVENIYAENCLLRERLEELGFPLGHTALSDSEKELLISRKKCNSAPPSISGAASTTTVGLLGSLLYGKDGGVEAMDSDPEVAAGRGSLDWDKQSSSSVSEMSVACLQDRIMQMEETHYSTSEELQATLQELSDLQDQLTELQSDNERLNEEKAMFLESLCAKVQQLEECRSQVESLRQLLLQQHDDNDDVEGKSMLTTSEREQNLIELLKGSQNEKDALVVKLDELKQDITLAKSEVSDAQLQAAAALDRARLLESTVDSANADKRLLERQLAECREQLSSEHIEINRMRMLLDTERAKVHELQQARQVQDKSELDELLDQARKEKDRLESRATSLQEQLALSQCQTDRLREQLTVHQEESMVAKNNAREQMSDLEYRLEQVLGAKEDVQSRLLDVQEVVCELEEKCQRHLEDKRELRATISDLQKKLNENSGRADAVQRQLDELSQKHEKETEEWKQFQSDLLMTVRVANDFKTEAQQDVENLMTEMRHLLDRIQSLETENERLKAMKTTTSPTFHRRPLPPEGVLINVEQEIVRQCRAGRADARQSVKSLIESIENASKQSKSGNNGSSGPGSNKSSPGSGTTSPTNERTILSPILKRPSDSDLYIKPPNRPLSSSGSDSCSSILRDQKNQANTVRPQRVEGNGGGIKSPTSNNNNIINNKSGNGNDKNQHHILTSPPTSSSGCRPDVVDSTSQPTFKPAAIVSPTPVSILANKSDTVKRSSYGDSTDKKDPLTTLARGGGSRRNALLKWCQNKTIGYRGIDITNFSSSWNDGLAFCAILHSYVPDLIPYDMLDNKDKRRNFTLAFQAAESVGIPTLLNINDMISMERPDWQSIMSYVTSIYKHFET